MKTFYRYKRNQAHKLTTEHRYVMEQHLGRKLSYEEVVHHINGDRKDNRIENLQVMTPSHHRLLHSGNLYVQIYGIKRCDCCGRILPVHKFDKQTLNQNNPVPYCKRCRRSGLAYL